MPTLIITEKPAVAKYIAQVLNVHDHRSGYIEGNGYIIAWTIGHLVELAEPEAYNTEYKKWNLSDLPIIPSFLLKIKPNTCKQFEILKHLLNSSEVSEVICATDAGREGQLIFEWVYRAAKCKKPVKRLWVNSYTEKSIQKGFASLKDNREYETLFQSAQARAHADWLFGINMTRAISCINNEVFSLGRVQTPTLALIVNRQAEINNFVSKPYFQVQGVFKSVNFLYKNEDNETNLANKESAETILSAVMGKPGIVTHVGQAKKTEERPLLYDLTDLQKEVNIKYGLTAQETLNIAQSLYEKHKLITYPRTESTYLSTDVAGEIKMILGQVGLGWTETQPLIKHICAQGLNIDKRIANDEKVSDHHAIIPTENACNYAKLSLTENEDKIYKLIVLRLIAAVAQKYEYLETSVVINVDGHMFYATYKNPVFYGWKDVYRKLLPSVKKDETVEAVFAQNEKVSADKYEMLEKMTTPPKPYTEASLVSTMKNISRKIEDSSLKQFVPRGLGTTATRAAIIERLKKINYIETKGKYLIPTQKGINLIRVAPTKLKLPELTAEWEERLENIYNQTEQVESFMQGIQEHVSVILNDIKSNVTQYQIAFGSPRSNGREVIGECPRCKMPIYENSKAFSCSGYKNNPPCNFTLWKEDKWFQIFDKKITKTMAKKFLTKGECMVKGMKKKDRSATFDATIIIDISHEKWVSFTFKPRNKQ